MIDDDVHQRVKPTRLGKVLDRYRQGSEGQPPVGAADGGSGTMETSVETSVNGSFATSQRGDI
jgi:hypothetical protein